MGQVKIFKPEADPRSLYGPGQSMLRRPRLAAALKIPKAPKVKLAKMTTPIAGPMPFKSLMGIKPIK